MALPGFHRPSDPAIIDHALANTLSLPWLSKFRFTIGAVRTCANMYADIHCVWDVKTITDVILYCPSTHERYREKCDFRRTNPLRRTVTSSNVQSIWTDRGTEILKRCLLTSECTGDGCEVIKKIFWLAFETGRRASVFLALFFWLKLLSERAQCCKKQDAREKKF